MMNRAIRPDVALHPSQLRLRIPSGVRPATRFSGAWQPAPVPSLMGEDDDNSLIETLFHVATNPEELTKSLRELAETVCCGCVK